MSVKIKIKHSWNKLRFYLSFLLLAFYLTIGFLFLFTDTWIDLLPQGRSSIGIVLILFGTLRFYIAYRRYINKLLRIKTSVKEKETAHVE
jgi:cytochrome c biogenesis protein CcdA